jgi:uncharacterized repeat protein (TIGR04076 family)
MASVKITVIRKLSIRDVYGDEDPIALSRGFSKACPRLNVGDEFISEEGACPAGFCNWAFADIQRDITHLRFGGSFPWAERDNQTVACCTDGLRPVFFKLERV